MDALDIYIEQQLAATAAPAAQPPMTDARWVDQQRAQMPGALPVPAFNPDARDPTRQFREMETAPQPLTEYRTWLATQGDEGAQLAQHAPPEVIHSLMQMQPQQVQQYLAARQAQTDPSYAGMVYSTPGIKQAIDLGAGIAQGGLGDLVSHALTTAGGTLEGGYDRLTEMAIDASGNRALIDANLKDEHGRMLPEVRDDANDPMRQMANAYYDAGRATSTMFRPDGAGAAFTAGRITGNVAGTAGPYLLGAKALALANMGTQAFGGSVQDYIAHAEANGIDRNTADMFKVGIGNAAVEIISERLGLGVIGNIGGKAINRVGDLLLRGQRGKAASAIAGALGASSATNAIEEALAQVGQNIVDKAVYDMDRHIGEGVGDAAAIGAAAGPLIGGAGMTINALRNRAGSDQGVRGTEPFDQAQDRQQIDPRAIESGLVTDPARTPFSQGQEEGVPVRSDLSRRLVPPSKMKNTPPPTEMENVRYIDDSGSTTQLGHRPGVSPMQEPTNVSQEQSQQTPVQVAQQPQPESEVGSPARTAGQPVDQRQAQAGIGAEVDTVRADQAGTGAVEQREYSMSDSRDDLLEAAESLGVLDGPKTKTKLLERVQGAMKWSHMRGLEHVEYKDAINNMSKDERSAYLAWDRSVRSGKARSRAGSKGVATKQRKAEALSKRESTPQGQRVIAAEKKINLLGTLAQEGKEIPEGEWTTAQIELEEASLAERLLNSANEPTVEESRRDAELPDYTIESGPSPAKAMRSTGIPWRVSLFDGDSPAIISGARVEDAGNGKRRIVLYGIDKGTMDGTHGALMVHFDSGDPSVSRRARRLVWQIANGKSRETDTQTLRSEIEGNPKQTAAPTGQPDITIPNLGAGANAGQSKVTGFPQNTRTTPTTQVTDRTIAQAAKDRPEKLPGQIKRIRAGKEQPRTYRQIMEDLSSALNLSAPATGGARSLGRMGGSLGFYRPLRREIRNKSATDVDTHIHEVGHALHEMLFSGYRESMIAKPGERRRPINLTFPKEWRGDLTKLGKQLYGNTQPAIGYAGEGWAEVVRYLVVDPSHLKTQTPTLYKAVVGKMMAEHPEAYNALMRARAQFKQTEAQDNPVAKYRRSSLGRIPWRHARDFYDSLRTHLFDRMQRADTMRKDLKLDLPADKDPYIRALRTNGLIGGHVEHVLHWGTWDTNKPGEGVTGKSIEQTLAPVMNDIRGWEDYMIAKRALEKRSQGFRVMPEESTASLRSFVDRSERDNPHYKDVADDFQKLNEWLIGHYAVNHGLISEESAQQIIAKNLHYITFRYENGDTSSASMGRYRQSMTNQTSGIKRFSGEGADLIDPIAAFLSNVQTIVARAQLNATARTFTDLYDKAIPEIGRWIGKIDTPMKPQRVHDDQYKQSVLSQLGPVVSRLPEAERDAVFDAIENMDTPTFFENSVQANKEKRQFSVLVDGKRVWYEAKDDRLFKLIEGMVNPQQVEGLLRFLTIPAKTLRAGATANNPSFFLPNLIRDMIQSVVMTKKRWRDLPKDAKQRVRGMNEAFTGGEIERLFLLSGADMSGILSDAIDPKTNVIKPSMIFGTKLRYRQDARKVAAEAAKDIATLAPIRAGNRGIERLSRFSEFEAVRDGETGISALMEAGQAAADITLDFQRGGTFSKAVNQYVPFFNATMLGTDKLGRFFKEDPITAVTRTIALTMMPSIVTMLLNYDDEDYWAIPKDQRDRYWFIPRGRNAQGKMQYTRIPKPYGLGIASIVTERLFATHLGINPETGERKDPRATDGMVTAVVNQLRPDFMVAFMQPLIEVTANYDFFRQRPIVSRGDETLPEADQGAAFASATARQIGKMLDVSPAKVDHLISGYFGGLGEDVVGLGLDPMVSMVTGETKGERVRQQDIEGLPVLRSFLARETMFQHQAFDRFFNDFDEYQKVHRKMNSLEGDEAAKYTERHQYELQRYYAFNSVRTQLLRLFKERRNVIEQAKEDPEKAERRLLELQRAGLSMIQGLYRSTRRSR